MATIFLSYSHRDQELRDRLEAHLAPLKREGLIESWHDRKILPGASFKEEIDRELERATIVLLLVSADFINSDYCVNIEMRRALEREANGEARVIPIILRACDWHPMPFGRLMALPKDGRPITLWPDIDEALLDVATGLRRVAESSHSRAAVGAPPAEILPRASSNAQPRHQSMRPGSSARVTETHRSSNLGIVKEFTDEQRDEFLSQSFDFVASYFENSLVELQSREPTVSGKFTRIDATQFSAVIYRQGAIQARCIIRLSTEGHMGQGIQYSRDGAGGFNELLRVERDDYALFLRGLMGFTSNARKEKLSQRDAADLLWDAFIAPLQMRG